MIPVVEALFRARWSTTDGLGALIISPTRELTMQIFEVIKVVCSHHFSITAGYVTGGKRVADEAKFIKGLNILVATPGRLLQHLEQTPGFDAGSLQVLVLDEADRLLDMGFEEQLNSIVEYLPAERQTLLFSATQTKSVRAVAAVAMCAHVCVPMSSHALTMVRTGERSGTAEHAGPGIRGCARESDDGDAGQPVAVLHRVPPPGQNEPALLLREVAPQGQDHRVPVVVQASAFRVRSHASCATWGVGYGTPRQAEAQEAKLGVHDFCA